MKFSMPTEPSHRTKMYEAMLARVVEAKEHVIEQMARISPELDSRAAAGEDARELYQTHKKLHLQELCLVDQEGRLKEVISSHRIGASTASCRAGE
jgi:hypothetical protein